MLARQRRSLARRQQLIRRLESLPSFAPAEAEAVDAAIDAARLGPGLARPLDGGPQDPVAALAKLRPRDQELLRLVAHEGLSPAQAGEALGLNPNTARIRLFRARARVKDLLAAAGGAAPAGESRAESGVQP